MTRTATKGGLKTGMDRPRIAAHPSMRGGISPVWAESPKLTSDARRLIIMEKFADGWSTRTGRVVARLRMP